MKRLFSFFLFVLLPTSILCSVRYSVDGNSGEEGAVLWRNLKNFSTLQRQALTGELVLADPSNACELNNPEQYEGKIIVIYGREGVGCSRETKLRLVQDVKAIGVLQPRNSEGMISLSAYSFAERKPDDIYLPYYSTTYKMGVIIKEALNANKQMNVTITADANKWTEIGNNPGSWIWQFFFLIWNTANVVICFRNIYYFIRIQGCRPTIPIVSLTLEIIANLERVIYFLDGLSWRELFPSVAKTVLLSLSFPFSIATILLLSFWWKEITGKRLNSNLNRLDKFKWPFIIICAIIIFLELMFAILRAFYISFPSSIIITVSFYLAITVVMGIFFAWTGFKIFKIVKGFSSQVAERKKMMIGICRLICISIIGMAIYCIGGAFEAAPFQSSSEGAYLFTWTLIYFGFTFTGTTQILSLNPRALKDQSSDSKNGDLSDTKAGSAELTKSDLSSISSIDLDLRSSTMDINTPRTSTFELEETRSTTPCLELTNEENNKEYNQDVTVRIPNDGDEDDENV
eukprot:TRINITY_DN1445_c0_g1_i4.p1 TRINITY_DN1445_c0_g1~~TRINITY_DN1445_c0_g1_i4.p1  ORF type:complete len:516 (-),score=88.82 TRINITY_DN1445_c0_g1_i4:43-1590(-)